MQKQYCLYYRAYVVPAECWFLTGVLRSFEHVAFDRTIDTQNSIFEFFVPEAMQHVFEELMTYFQQHEIIKDLERVENRLLHEEF